MKEHTTYECDTCGFRSRNVAEIEDCEESHVGFGQLTIYATRGYKREQRLPDAIAIQGPDDGLHIYIKSTLSGHSDIDPARLGNWLGGRWWERGTG